jgi:hypothetical protein
LTGFAWGAGLATTFAEAPFTEAPFAGGALADALAVAFDTGLAAGLATDFALAFGGGALATTLDVALDVPLAAAFAATGRRAAVCADVRPPARAAGRAAGVAAGRAEGAGREGEWRGLLTTGPG